MNQTAYPPTPSLELGLIGNGQVSSLVDARARHVWTCFPRFDGDPVFCALLRDPADPDGHGVLDVELDGGRPAGQRYLGNTPVLETLLDAADGSRIRVLDYCPRFQQFGRAFHPAMIARRLEPIAGKPQLTVRARPMTGYGSRLAEAHAGSSHVTFSGEGESLRLTSDLPVSAIIEERRILLQQPATLIIGPDEPIPEAVGPLGARLLEETLHYWNDWCRGLAIPFEWQEAVIRAAITLRLCAFEDTGAIVAAMTTSIPEHAGSTRNWDYRYCWLRDSYFTIRALNGLGATQTMENFMRYLRNVATGAEGSGLQPVYGISGESSLTERVAEALPGYRGMGPVRTGNAAHDQVQNDVYGAVILTAAQAFFDRRLAQPGDAGDFARLERAGARCLERYDKPDAGPWEFRKRSAIHTYSSVMCWAGVDRLARIAAHLGLADQAASWRERAWRMHEHICSRAWNESLGCFTTAWGGQTIDASLLLLAELGFVTADDPRFQATLGAIERKLLRGGYLMRYVEDDDFGQPRNAFTVCTFWYVRALANCGRFAEARALFDKLLSRRTALGLLSEDLDVRTGELWGNFPQAYSMVGIIGAATRLSAGWEEAL